MGYEFLLRYMVVMTGKTVEASGEILLRYLEFYISGGTVQEVYML